jgi:hypothetical protein
MVVKGYEDNLGTACGAQGCRRDFLWRKQNVKETDEWAFFRLICVLRNLVMFILAANEWGRASAAPGDNTTTHAQVESTGRFNLSAVPAGLPLLPPPPPTSRLQSWRTKIPPCNPLSRTRTWTQTPPLHPVHVGETTLHTQGSLMPEA